MFVFIFINLYLGFVLQAKTPVHAFLLSDFSLALGCLLLLLALIATGFKLKKIAYKIRYDCFAVGAVLVWFAYWPPHFRQDTLVFDYFPLYFAFITAFSSLVFITKRENIDPNTLSFLQHLSDSGRFNPIIIMLVVIAGLALPRHFLLLPSAITILVTRFALASCLDNE